MHGIARDRVGHQIALGRGFTGQTVAVLVSETTLAVELDDADVRVSRRTTTEPVRSIKDSGHGPLASNFLGHMMHIRWQTATVELVASFEDLECLSSDRPKQSSATMR